MQVPHKILHIEDVRAYVHCKFERIGDNDLHKDLDLECNNDLSLKKGFEYLSGLNIVDVGASSGVREILYYPKNMVSVSFYLMFYIYRFPFGPNRDSNSHSSTINFLG